jgi:hypothetical protein
MAVAPGVRYESVMTIRVFIGAIRGQAAAARA